MNMMETRLRDAITSAAQTVSPDVVRRLELAISEPATYQRPAPAQRQARNRWLMISPVAAAAALACIAVLFALLTSPGARRPQHQRTANEWVLSAKGEPKFMVIDAAGRRQRVQVRNAATGVVVAHVRVPRLHARQRIYISDIATANGRSYLVSMYQVKPCRSWLYQFTISSKGQPSAVTPFASLPTMSGAAIYNMTISRDGHWLAFASISSGAPCSMARPGPSHIGLTNIGTGQTKQWTFPRSSEVENVTLTADGGLLLYPYQPKIVTPHAGPSELRALPASAPPGNAPTLGYTVVKAARFGPGAWISFSAITPDGRRTYFSVYPANDAGPGQIWVIGLAGGPARFITGHAQYPGVIYADVRVRFLLMHIHNRFSRLTLATGKVTVMPRIWHHIFAYDIAW